LPVTEQQTWSLDIRDAFFNALNADPYFAAYTRRKTKMLPVQPALIPYLGVYQIDENMTPDGDANAGCIRFTHTLRVGFSVVHANNDQVAIEKSVDAAQQHIMMRLWTDAHINNVWKSGNPEGALIEAIVRGTSRKVWGSAGAKNETPICELEYNVSCTYRTEWFPDITDTLNEIDVTTGVKAGDTQAEMAQRQQVTVKYMFSALRAALQKGNGHG